MDKLDIKEIQEFVREKCIMAAHPGCETLKEALGKELILGCLVNFAYSNQNGVLKKVKGTIFRQHSDRTYSYIYDINFNGSFVTGRGDKKYFEIIGLPLTLSRVLNALVRMQPYCVNCLIQGKLALISPVYDGFDLHTSQCIEYKVLNDDGTDILFEDQSEVTQIEIAKLLGWENNI